MTPKEFEIQSVSATSLAEQFGTPLFVYDTEILSRTYCEIATLLPEPVEVMFSLKANPNVSVCSFLAGLGAGAEVSSHTELVTARRAGVPPDRIVYVGPGKSEEELRACVTEGIAAVVCESLEELAHLDALAGERARRCRAVLRVNPAFTARDETDWCEMRQAGEEPR